MTAANGTLTFLFESAASGGWVDVLADSTLVKGYIASQNAGSINASIYYQVGGDGLNKRFAVPLAGAHQLQDVNAMLKLSYDNIYGKGAWAKDSSARNPRSDRLTSILVELLPGQGAIGSRVCAMMYSVGPILGKAGIIDESQYRQIYTDALKALAAWNDGADPASGYFPISALRITMLSCGIYGQVVDDVAALEVTSAKCIIQGLCDAAKDPDCKSALDTVILINSNKGTQEQRRAFTTAAQALSVKVSATGFSVNY